ncbi:hypothetical protein FACS189456_4080 [Bacteroidia bacterium]|nr:hypothetical protein FACS189456_4080 [Bacteroidia bacterium]
MLVLFLFLAAAGYYCWTRLAIDAYPDIADTTVQIVTQVSGLAAEEIEQQISIPIERTVNGLPGMIVMRSKNTFGLSTVILVFDDGIDDYWARQRVQERLSGLELPYNAVPELNPLTSPTGEIFRYIIESDRLDLREITDLHKWTIIPRLKQIAGIADASNYGGITTQYQIEVDPHKLEQYNITLADITEKVEKNNTNAGGSMLSHGDLSYVIRGIGLVKDLEDLGHIVIKTEHGVAICLNDIGKLKYGNLERKGVLGFKDAARDYSDGVEGIVQLLRGENPSRVLAEVHKAIDELNNEILPEGTRIHPFMDRTELVATTLHTVSHTLLEGMILVILVLILFLGSWRGALLVALTIPFALLIAFILMHLTNIPANLLSLGAIDFGILVDGAIVMMETILKKRERNPMEMLSESSIFDRVVEVARPIFFSTLIIITAYLPLFAFEHIEKKLFTPMAYTVGYALLGALGVALFLIPGLAFSVYRKPRKMYHNRWLEKLSEMYHRQTTKLLNKPKRVLIPLFVTLVAAGALSYTVGKDFLPPLDEGSIWIQVQLPAGISIEKSKGMGAELRKTLQEFDEVSYVMTQVGRDDEGAEAFSLSHVECGVGLKPYNTWKRGKTKADLIEEMSKKLSSMAGYTVGFSQPIIDMVMDMVAGAHSDLALKIYGEDITETRRVADRIAAVLQEIPGAVDVAVDQEPPLPQLQIIANRERIAQYGLNVSDVAELIELAIGGTAISQIYIGSKSYDVICRFGDEHRNSPEKIGNLLLTAASGAKIPLSQVAEIKMTTGASTISREMNKRHLTVRVNLRGVDLTGFLKKANQEINQQVSFNHNTIHLKWDGQFENQNRAYSRLGVIIPLALGVMLLLLFGACGKFRQAALMMSVVPLALFGGMLALNVRGMTLNVSSAVGFIALIGVAIQNGVIMLSHINNLRCNGYELKQAVVDGTRHRFRPVLMTATVAILGLLPASLSTGIGSDVQRPLATVIVYGLLFATIITLYVLPSLYYMVENYSLRHNKTERIGNMKKRFYILCTLLVTCSIAHTQTIEKVQQPLNYRTYIELVGRQNLGYVAEKLNVSIADAEVKAAGVFNDPAISMEYGNNDDRRIQMGQSVSVELSKTFSIGKRSAGIDLAKSEKALCDALLNDYFHRLRAESTLAYLEAIKQTELYRVKEDSYENMRRLAEGDSIKHALGKITKVDAVQSTLEAEMSHNELMQAQTELYNSYASLALWTGTFSRDTLYAPTGTLYLAQRVFNTDKLLEISLENRADLAAALKNVDVARKALTAARRERGTDFDLAVGYNYNTEVRNEIAPAPKFNGITVGISIPLKFSNLNRSTLHTAELQAQQAEINYKQAELEVQNSVMQSVRQYLSLSEQVSRYNNGLLANAQSVMDGKMYAYDRGETSLLDVLNARRTYDDLRITYIETLYNQAAALVELERNVGIWDIMVE